MDNLGSPQCKFFACLIVQNRVWSSDQLARRGWDHNLTSPLCRCEMETAHHILAGCRLIRRIWTLVAAWTAQPNLDPERWPHSSTTFEWWSNITTTPATPAQGNTKSNGPRNMGTMERKKEMQEFLDIKARRCHQSWPP